MLTRTNRCPWLPKLLAIVLTISLPLVGNGQDEKEKGDAKSKAPQTKSDQDSPTGKQDASNSSSAEPKNEPGQANGKNSATNGEAIPTVTLKDEWFNNKNWFQNVDDQPSSVFDPIDTTFGDLIVTPVSNVFFYDIYPFDNQRAKTHATLANLRKAIKDAQKELKTVQKKLGIVTEDDDDSGEKEEKEDADEDEASEPKELTGDDFVKLRNGLKTKIRDAIDVLLKTKLPSAEIKKTVIQLKQPFFELDFAIRQTQDQKPTKDLMVATLEKVKSAVAELGNYQTLSKNEYAWALCDNLKDSERTQYFRGFNTSEIDSKVAKFETNESFKTSLDQLVESKYLVEDAGTYSIAQKEKDGKNEDVKYESINIPFIVAWLVFGAIFFTLRMTFINIRGFTHAIKVTKGDYDDPNDPGEISHFQALSSALSATVGLGNIAGVAIAVSMGGPGALVWMIFAGFLGMTSKFTECTLGQMYRKVDDNGQVLGGPMRYLSAGLSEMNLGVLGKLLAVMFVILCIGGSFGGGNMFQANQSCAAVKDAIPFFEGKDLLYGVLLAFFVGLVILGGIKRIGTAAGVIVPFMCLIYVVAGLFVIFVNASAVPAAFGTMFAGAFSMKAGFGGLMGVLVIGFQRAAFSNEAGTGSASIAHSAAATDEPVREGIVALLEPFIDTIVVCTMTGLVVVITGAYQDGSDGVVMTSNAFGSVISWFPYVLSIAVVLFAFSTMISWSYYGERCSIWLFGPSASVPYKILFLVFVVLGAVLNLNNVLGFSDLMILGMAFPNILGLLLLSGKVRGALTDYMQKLNNGEFDREKKSGK